jgi:hypothetical protein
MVHAPPAFSDDYYILPEFAGDNSYAYWDAPYGYFDNEYNWANDTLPKWDSSNPSTVFNYYAPPYEGGSCQADATKIYGPIANIIIQNQNTLEVYGGNFTVANAYVGYGNVEYGNAEYSGEGTLIFSTGTQNVNNLYIGTDDTDVAGTFTQHSGTTLVQNIYLGKYSGSQGTVDQTTTSGVVGSAASPTNITMAEYSGSTGTYTIGSGTLNVRNITTGSGTADFNLEGGTVNVYGTLNFSNGTFHASGGNLNMFTSFTPDLVHYIFEPGSKVTMLGNYGGNTLTAPSVKFYDLAFDLSGPSETYTNNIGFQNSFTVGDPGELNGKMTVKHTTTSFQRLQVLTENNPVIDLNGDFEIASNASAAWLNFGTAGYGRIKVNLAGDLIMNNNAVANTTSLGADITFDGTGDQEVHYGTTNPVAVSAGTWRVQKTDNANPGTLTFDSNFILSRPLEMYDTVAGQWANKATIEGSLNLAGNLNISGSTPFASDSVVTMLGNYGGLTLTTPSYNGDQVKFYNLAFDLTAPSESYTNNIGIPNSFTVGDPGELNGKVMLKHTTTSFQQLQVLGNNSVIDLNGDLEIASNASAAYLTFGSGGNIKVNLAGDLIMNNNASANTTFLGGDITFDGAEDQTVYYGTTNPVVISGGSWTINKPSGTVNMDAILPYFNRPLTITSGELSIAGKTYSTDQPFFNDVNGVVWGYGTINATGGFTQKGLIIADGGGSENTLALTGMSSIITGENTSDDGWFAFNKGKLTLPTLSISSGNLTISLLAEDRSDVVPLGDNMQLIGVWDLVSSDLTFTSVNLIFRYDDALMVSFGIAEEDLAVFHYDGGSWVDVTSGIDMDNNLIFANGITHFSDFGLGGELPESVPEPATIFSLIGGLVMAAYRKVFKRKK